MCRAMTCSCTHSLLSFSLASQVENVSRGNRTQQVLLLLPLLSCFSFHRYSLLDSICVNIETVSFFCLCLTSSLATHSFILRRFNSCCRFISFVVVFFFFLILLLFSIHSIHVEKYDCMAHIVFHIVLPIWCNVCDLRVVKCVFFVRRRLNANNLFFRWETQQ